MSKKNKDNKKAEKPVEEPQVEQQLDNEQTQEQEAPQDEAQPEVTVEQLQQQLEAQQKEYLLLMAEFDNFRRRTLKEKQDIIKNAAESDFLNGSGQKGWIADFDWMMVPQHFQRVLENFYRNKQVTQSQYETANGHQDPRRGVEATGTNYAAGYDRPL